MSVLSAVLRTSRMQVITVYRALLCDPAPSAAPCHMDTWIKVSWRGLGAADLHAWQRINADALGTAMQGMLSMHPIQHQALRQQPSNVHHRGRRWHAAAAQVMQSLSQG